MAEPKFNLGMVVMTIGAQAMFEQLVESNPFNYLMRHARGDWGDVPPEDAKLNEESIETEDRLMSAYTLTDGTRIWIITDAGHETTTILLPEEY